MKSNQIKSNRRRGAHLGGIREARVAARSGRRGRALVVAHVQRAAGAVADLNARVAGEAHEDEARAHIWGGGVGCTTIAAKATTRAPESGNTIVMTRIASCRTRGSACVRSATP